MNIVENVALKPITKFDIGGSAQFFAEISSEREIKEIMMEGARLDVIPAIIAGGSNLLVADEGVRGFIVRVIGGRRYIRDSRVFVDAGCDLEETIRESAEAGLTGWESMAGIPGTVGGAVRGNAGAFGTEIKDVLEGVRAFNMITKKVHSLVPSQCGLMYRDSLFKKRPEWIITSAIIRLARSDSGESKYKIDETIAERNRRHIQNVKAAGSFFTNPIVPTALSRQFECEKGQEARGRRVPAGWLIEKAGFKGARIGDAVASEQHPNYLCNAGEARAEDVRKLARDIKNAVFRQFDVVLEEEVTQLGFDF